MPIIQATAPPPAYAPPAMPCCLLRRPYKPLTESERIKVAKDMEGVRARPNALLAKGVVHV